MATPNECWIVYTHDVRFPTTQIHEVYTNEEAATARAAYLNEDDLARGTSQEIRYSHATRFLLRDEAVID